jgi:predicted alpha-1,2-mannosidase
MKTTHFILSSLLSAAVTAASAQDLADYVNPFIGASTDVELAGAYHGLGKTFPGADTPYGMVQVSPQTITGGDNGPGYSYQHKTIEGFAMNNMSGIGWNGDLGNFLVMPTTGKLLTSAGREDSSQQGYRSTYEKATETAKAGYYACRLSTYGIDVETTASTHCGALRFTFPENRQSRIQIDLARRVGGTAEMEKVEVVDDHTIQGYMHCTPDGGGWGDGQGHSEYTVYFYATFSKPLKNYGSWSADISAGQSRHLDDVISDAYQARIANATVTAGKKVTEGRHIGFYTEFPTTRGEQVEMKVGISYVDVDGAKKNYMAEVADKNFETIKNEAHDAWNEALGKVKVEGGTYEDKVVFYTCMYHAMIDPRIHQDVDGRYVGGDQKVYISDQTFTKRTVFSGWDVFRSQFPLQTIINPTLVSDMINSLTTMAEQSGRRYYERWELMNAYSGCMLGNPALSVIADAYAKGIRSFDAEKALQYMKNSSAKFGNDSLGYTPGGLSISYTLEYAYTDWCIAHMAQLMGKGKDYKTYLQKSKAYNNIFDKQKGWFRPRNEDGSWQEWPEEGRLKEWYGCIECNPLQQGWFVPHDVPGMVKLMGGTKKVIADLDWMFGKTPSDMLWNIYYNHANEPVHFVPFLYNRLGAPWKTQYWTRFICRHAYDEKMETGLKGNEDVGQMSAWYILASSGLHPYCPGETRYEITSPLFSKSTMQVGGGKTFTVVANNNSETNVYIQKATLNGKKYNKCYIDYKDIAAGGTLVLEMGAEPNKSWGK